MSEKSSLWAEAHDWRASEMLIMPWVGTLDPAAVCAGPTLSPSKKLAPYGQSLHFVWLCI